MTFAAAVTLGTAPALFPEGVEGQGVGNAQAKSWGKGKGGAAPPGLAIRRVPTGNEANAVALADLRTLLDTGRATPHDLTYLRYVWVRSGTAQDGQVCSLVTNLWNRNPGLYRPLPLTDGAGTLVMRLDLRNYAPEREWPELLETWEELQFDPRFNQLLTKDVLAQVCAIFPERGGYGTVCGWHQATVPPYTYKGADGKVTTYNRRWVVGRQRQRFTFREIAARLKAKEVDLIRLASPYLEPKVRADLEALTHSVAPVVSDGYYTLRTMSQIQDKGVFTIIYGGLWYRLAGIRKAAKKGLTDEDQLFADIGAADIQGGARAKDVFEKLRSDQRIAMFRSKVTSGPRRASFFRSRLGRFESSRSTVSFTDDIAKKDIDVGTHPMRNLLDGKFIAREGLWDGANGLQRAALIKILDGSLQDEVPPDVANDSMIPSPHHQRLQPIISCIRCHWTKGDDGWIPAHNSVKRVVGPGKRLDILGDVSRLKDSLYETNRRLAELYAGEPERGLVQDRMNLSAAVLQATGPWPGGGAQTDIVRQAGKRLVQMYDDYWYGAVDARVALREFGLEVRGPLYEKVLAELLRPEVRAAQFVPDLATVVIPEDVVAGGLLEGEAVNRTDFDLFHSFGAERVRHNLLRMLAQPKRN